MRIYSLIASCILLSLTCVNLSGQGQTAFCDPDNIYCDLNELSGEMFDMFTEDDATDGPNPLCSNSGFPHNTSWFGFVAGSTSATIQLQLTDCDPGDCGNGTNNCWGVQLGAYESCDWQNEVFCDVNDCEPADAIQDPYTGLYSYTRTYVLPGLNEGDDYFIFLDGCGGSFCHYEVTITGAGAAFTPEFWPAPNPPIDCDGCDDINNICVGSNIDLIPLDKAGDEYSLSISFDWEVTTPSGATFNFQEDGNNNLNYTFTEPGPYTVCVQASTICDDNEQRCLDILIIEYDDEDFGVVEICQDVIEMGLDQDDINDLIGTTDPSDMIGNIDLNGDGESGLQENYDIFSPGIVGGQTTNSAGCQWQEMVEIVQIDNDSDIDLTIYLCEGDQVILPGGVVIDDTEEDPEEYEYTATNGCTAIYNVISWALEIDEFIVLQGDCGNDGVDVLFDPASIELEDIDLNDDFLNAGGMISWIWTRNGLPITGSENALSWVVPFGDTERYSVNITLSIVDPYTGLTIECDHPILANQIFVVADPALSSPVVNFDSEMTFCPEDSMSAMITLDIFGFDPAGGSEVTWTTPTDVAVLSGGSLVDNTILLDYSGTTGNTPVSNTVLFSVSGSCGQPTTGEIEVTFAPSDTLQLDLIGVECPDSTFTLQAFGLPTSVNVDTIIWDLDGGILVSGDTTMITQGPLEVEWPGDTDQKTVSVTIRYEAACANYETVEMIDFIIDPQPPTVTCFSNQSMITYEWDAVADASSYLITLPDGTTETITATTYEITGLAENVCQNITVQAMTASGAMDYCGEILGSNPIDACCTKTCPATTATIINPYTDTICLGLNESIEFFTKTFSEAVGVGQDNWSGPGIDLLSGAFNPSDAGVGTHTIEYYYEFQDSAIDGCRTPVVTTQVTITQLPIFEMTVSPTTVCLGEEVTISFSGDYDPTLNTNLFTNGATIVNDSDPQNIIVSWDTPGSKTISSSITAAGCGDVTPQDLSVTVESLPDLNLTCVMQTSSSVTFEWDTDPGFTDYTVQIDSDAPFTTTDDFVAISGLAENTVVNISVTGNSNNSCMDVTEDDDCASVNCPTVTLQSNFTGIEYFCLDGTESSITIIGTPNDPAGELTNPEPVEITIDDADLPGGVFDPTVFGAGNYNIELVLREDNCMWLTSFDIVVEDAPELSLDAPTRICIDQPWDINFTGEVNNDFNYTWASTNGDIFSGTGNQQIDFDTPGNYTLTVNASTTNNCNAMEAIAIVDVIDSLMTPELSCQESVGEILFSWIDGNDECENSYSISINNGPIIENTTNAQYLVQDLMPDTDVTITVINESDDCVCMNKQNSFTCRTNPCPPVSITLPYQENTICRDLSIGNYPDEVFEVTSVDDISTYTLTYTSEPALTFIGNALDVNALQEGVYVITATATDGFCVEEAQATLTIVDVPVLSFNHPDVICVEDDLTVTYAGGDLTDATFAWTGDGVSSFVNELNPVIAYDTPGDYTYTFEIDKGECDNSQDIFVTVLDSLRTPTVSCVAGLDEIEVTLSVEETNCDGELSLIINGEPYLGDLSSGSIMLDNQEPGSPYDIQVVNTSECGCDDKIGTTFCETDPCPAFNYSTTLETTLTTIEYSWTFDEPDCGGDISVLVDGAPYMGDITGNMLTLDQLDAEEEVDIVIIYTSNCGCDFEMPETVTTDLCPAFNFQSMQLTTLTTIDYSWTLDEPDCGGQTFVTIDGVMFTGDISSNSIFIDQLPAGEPVEIEVSYVSNCGCDLDPNEPEIVTTDPCPDFNFMSECDTEFNSIDFTWSLNEPDCPGVTTISINGAPYIGDLSTGLIELTDLEAEENIEFVVIYASDCGCGDTFTVQCMTDECPTVNLEVVNSTSEFCLDPALIISHQLEVNVDGTTLAPSDVIWNGLGINTAGLINLDGSTTAPGIETYTAEYTIAGCTYEAATTVQYIAEPTFDLEVIDPCPGEGVATLNILNAQNDPNIVYTLDGVIIDNLAGLDVGDGQHTVEALAYDRCPFSESITFNAQPVIEIEILGETQSFAGVTNTYDINSNYTFDQIIWEINGETETGSPVDLAYFDPGQLCVTGFIGDCEATACVPVEVNTENVFIPNIFDPNADDPENATLKVFSNVEIDELGVISVFDRWGNRVFHAENVDPEDIRGQWDGTQNGEQLEQGVYVYVVEVVFLSGEVRQVVGDITLIR